MPLNYKVDIIIDETGEEVSRSGELSDEEVKLLEDFVQYADEVWNTDFIQTGEKGKVDISFDRESGTKITTVLPDWNQVMVLLHKFRPLLLNDEKTNFNYVRNLLGKKLDHLYFRSVLRLQQDLYGGKVAQAEYQLKSNQVLINSEKVLYAWLNSHEYHRDEDKKKFIESLHQFLPLDVSKVSFMKLLIHKAMAAKNLAGLIQVMLGKNQEIAVEVKRPSDSTPTEKSGGQ